MSTALKKERKPERPPRGGLATMVEAIRAVKADSQSLRLQNEFYERSKKPLETPQ